MQLLQDEVADGSERRWPRQSHSRRIMMNGAAGPSHMDRRERVLKLGESFEKHPRCAFHTVRCEWERSPGERGSSGYGGVEAQTSQLCSHKPPYSAGEWGAQRYPLPCLESRGFRGRSRSWAGVGKPWAERFKWAERETLWRRYTGVTVETDITGRWCRDG